MTCTVDIAYRDVEKSRSIDRLIHEKVQSLLRHCDHIQHCAVALEMPKKRRHSGNEYSVRIDLTVPPGHELVARHVAFEGEVSRPLENAVRRAFDAMRSRLQELVERQRDHVKTHEDS